MSERLTLQDLTDLLADKQGITKKDAEVFLRELFAVISENIEQNNSVKIKDFGTFKLVKVNSRKSVDVNTGEAIEIPAHYKLSFTPEKSLRDLLNAPFAHFESVVIEDGVDFERGKFEAENVSEDSEDLDSDPTLVVAAASIDKKEDEVSQSTSNDMEETEEIEELIEKDKEKAPVSESVEEEIVEEIVDETPLVPEEVVVEDTKPSSPEPPVPPTPVSTEEDDEEEDEDFAYLYEDENPKRKWLIIAALFLAIIGISLYMCWDDFKGFIGLDPKKVETVETATENTQPADTTAALLPTDTTSTAKVGEDNNVETSNDNSKTSEPDSKKEYTPKAVVRLEKGQTLRKLALKYYGNKSFWVYIYQENQDKIPNFNNVQVGQKLTIPANEKYGIDVSDSNSLSKAKALEDKYFR